MRRKLHREILIDAEICFCVVHETNQSISARSMVITNIKETTKDIVKGMLGIIENMGYGIIVSY